MRNVLEGRKFTLLLEGKVQRQDCDRGSEYYEYTSTEFWYEGAGRVIEKSTGEASMFLFETWAAEVSPFRASLEDQILISNRGHGGWDSKRNPDYHLPLIENRRPDLIDVLAQKVLEKISADTESIIPKYFFDRFSHAWLIDQGYLPGPDGQISLPGLVTT